MNHKQTTKRAKAQIRFQLAIYLDILSPIHYLSLEKWDEKHDPAKQVWWIQELDLITEKLKKFWSVCCDEENNVLTYYNRDIQEIMERDGHHIRG